MTKITKVFKKIQAFNSTYIAFSFNVWFNDRNFIQYLNNVEKTIEIGLGDEIEFEEFKRVETAEIKCYDSETELIVELNVKDIYKDFDIKLFFKNAEETIITNPYYFGDDTILKYKKVGFYIVQKEKYENNQTFKYKTTKSYKVITYNDYDFIYLVESKRLVPFEPIKAEIYKKNKVNILTSNINKETLKYFTIKSDLMEDCLLSYIIRKNDKNDKEVEITCHHNNHIEDLEFAIHLTGFKTTDRMVNDTLISVPYLFPHIDFILKKIKGDLNTKVISAFPSMGKTYFCKHNTDLTVLDSDSSKFSWVSEGVRHPDFPANYIQHIKENIGKADIIFVISHKQVRDALKVADIPFLVIYPKKNQKEEVCNRIKNRDGNDKLSSFIEKNWDSFFDEIELNSMNTNVLFIDGQISDNFDDVVNHLK